MSGTRWITRFADGTETDQTEIVVELLEQSAFYTKWLQDETGLNRDELNETFLYATGRIV